MKTSDYWVSIIEMNGTKRYLQGFDMLLNEPIWTPHLFDAVRFKGREDVRWANKLMKQLDPCHLVAFNTITGNVLRG